MAMITCPECKKEISDRAAACPHCGCPLVANTTQPPTAAANTASMDPPRKSKKMIGIMAAIIIVAIAGVCAGLFVHQNAIKRSRTDYINNLKLAEEYMLQGGAEAESTCNLIKSVWYNTIFKEFDSETDAYTRTGIISNDKNRMFHDDFNTALSKLYESDTYKDSVAVISASQDLAEEQMKKLQSPPDDLRDCYDTLNSLYEEYIGLTKLAVSPSGSLETYNKDFSSCDTEFKKYYDKLETQIPEN